MIAMEFINSKNNKMGILTNFMVMEIVFLDFNYQIMDIKMVFLLGIS